MADMKEKGTTRINWGDGKIVKVKRPNLLVIPGSSVICPPECNPVGEDGKQWKQNEEKTRNKSRIQLPTR